MIIGACGQIGTELTLALEERYGTKQVIAADIRQPSALLSKSIFEPLDVRDTNQLSSLIRKHKIEHLYHLAALLSAKGEEDPSYTWQLNANSTLALLEIARTSSIERVFFPSSIAVFGPSAPKRQAPQRCYLDPRTMYGVTKLAGERLSAYYRNKIWA